jgi:hypothetical protein
MGDVTQQKISSLIQTLERRFGKAERPDVVPPSASADAAAVATVAAKNAQIVAGVVLGLHGPPAEGFEAARKLMSHFVDWNEVRVSRSASLATALGRLPRAPVRVALLQRFLEAYFLRQRSLNLDHLYTLKHYEIRRFLSDLEAFDREELAAMLLTGFSFPVFPPSDQLREMALLTGIIKAKTTTLQMAKKFETSLSEKAEPLYALYANLYALVYDLEGQKLFVKRRNNKT